MTHVPYGDDRWHHIIVVTATYNQAPDYQIHWIEAAYTQAFLIYGKAGPEWEKMISPIVTSPINDARTFIIGPDGSKEGWDESDCGDELREQFIAWLESDAIRPEEGSSCLEWIEITYGDGDTAAPVIRSSNAARIVRDSDAPSRVPCPDGCPHSTILHDKNGCYQPGCSCTWKRSG